MKFIRTLYLDDAVREKSDTVIAKLKNGSFDRSVQVITLASNPTECLEFFPSYYLIEPGFERLDVTIVGLASDKASAKNMIVAIMTEVVNMTGNPKQVRNYLLNKD